MVYKKKGLWEWFQSFCGSYVDFLAPKLNVEAQIGVLHKVQLFLDKNFKTWIPNDAFPVLMMEALKFCLPTISKVKGRTPPVMNAHDGPLPPFLLFEPDRQTK